MDWFEFIRKTPDKISVPRFNGAGGLMGLRIKKSPGTNLIHLIRNR